MSADIDEIMSQLVFIAEDMALKDDAAGLGAEVAQASSELNRLSSRIEAIERHLGIAEDISA